MTPVAMSNYYFTQAITLRKQPIRDNDRLYVLYTKDLGKISALARGAGKISSKLAGHLEPFGQTSVIIVKKNAIPHLAGAQNKKIFSAISGELEILAIASRCLRITNELVKEGHPDVDIYNLLLEVFEFLETKPKKEKLEVVYSVYILKLLTQLGYRPEIYHCLACRNDIKPEDNFFNFIKGGLVCPCCQSSEAGFKVSLNMIKFLRAALNYNFQDLSKIKFNSLAASNFNQIINQFLIQRF